MSTEILKRLFQKPQQISQAKVPDESRSTPLESNSIASSGSKSGHQALSHKVQSQFRKPLHPLHQHVSVPSAPQSDEQIERCYLVLYSENTKKKHKTVFDGVLITKGSRVQLKSEDGKDVHSRLMPPKQSPSGYSIGTELEMGRYLVEITRLVSNEEYLAGRIFIHGVADFSKTPISSKRKSAELDENESATQFVSKSSTFGKAFKPPTVVTASASIHSFQSVSTSTMPSESAPSTSNILKGFLAAPRISSASSFERASSSGINLPVDSKAPLSSLSSSALIESHLTNRYQSSIHDPFAPNAVVLNPVDAALIRVDDQSGTTRYVPADNLTSSPALKIQVPIVVDPYIGKHLRPHQRAGVQFLFNCVTGRGLQQNESDSTSSSSSMRHFGCILADDMGLGKSIQTIALVWTLLKQGINGPSTPTIRRAMIVVPATLVVNWEREFQKWLGRERLRTITISSDSKAAEQKSLISDFVQTRSAPVLILSYELLRKHIDTLQEADIGLVVCDEGHRLKNAAGNRTIESLTALPTQRRVILTGTPVQNHLEELFGMCNYVCPGVLGGVQAFRHAFATPIERSRDKNCTPSEKALGDARAKELMRIISAFVLRRTRQINQRFLPPRVEQVVFCRLSSLQTTLYKQLTRSKEVLESIRSISSLSSKSESTAPALQCISTLRKLSVHPLMLYAESIASRSSASASSTNSRFSGLLEFFPESYLHSSQKICISANHALYDDDESSSSSSVSSSTATSSSIVCTDSDLHLEDSGKLLALDRLLRSIRQQSPDDRVVLVSTHTSTLDLIEQLCRMRKFNTLRLDGSTKASQRMSLVHRFNSAPLKSLTNDENFMIFLLSAKAGGVGLNLIGGNRCILFDNDWNPATDEQVMARCWRDGQKKTVYIYRLLSIGSIDEVIFQRQIKKNEFKITETTSTSAQSSLDESIRHFSSDDLRELFQLHDSSPYCHTFQLLLDLEAQQSKAAYSQMILSKSLSSSSSSSSIPCSVTSVSSFSSSSSSVALTQKMQTQSVQLSHWSFCGLPSLIEDLSLASAMQSTSHDGLSVISCAAIRQTSNYLLKKEAPGEEFCSKKSDNENSTPGDEELDDGISVDTDWEAFCGAVATDAENVFPFADSSALSSSSSTSATGIDDFVNEPHESTQNSIKSNKSRFSFATDQLPDEIDGEELDLASDDCPQSNANTRPMLKSATSFLARSFGSFKSNI